VPNGGIDAASPSTSVHHGHRCRRPTGEQRQDDVRDEDAAVDRPEHLDADLARVGDVLDVHPDQQPQPRHSLEQGDDLEQRDDGTGGHAPSLGGDRSAEPGTAAG